MPSYDEILQMPRRYWAYNYSIHQDPTDQKIYNLHHKNQTIYSVRDPFNPKFKVGDIVLATKLGEYGEIIEVKQDLEWGNHQYDVDCFNENVMSYYYRDESELERL